MLQLQEEVPTHYTTEALLDLAAAAAKSLPLCPILCNPKDSSPPDSVILGILQARTVEWVAISFSIDLANACLNFFICLAHVKRSHLQLQDQGYLPSLLCS